MPQRPQELGVPVQEGPTLEDFDVPCEAKVENCFTTFLEPHLVHTTGSSEERTKSSNA